jgi:hypothetical protein
VTNDNRLRKLHFPAEPGNIVCKSWYIVAGLRLVTAATPPQIQRYHSVGYFKVVELRLEEGMVATPAVYEYQWWIAISFLLIIQTHLIPFYVGRKDLLLVLY